MGEARRRGTFEERKAEAIAAGRVKTPAKKWERQTQSAEDGAGYVLAMARLMIAKGLSRKRQ